MILLQGASISIAHDESSRRWLAIVRAGDKELYALDTLPELAIGRACILLSSASDEELKALQERCEQELKRAAERS